MKKLILSLLTLVLLITLTACVAISNLGQPKLAIPVRPTEFPLTRPGIGNTMIFTGSYQTFALKSDGTVVGIGNNGNHQSDVSSWTDIVAVAGADFHTAGLRSDGMVVVIGHYPGDGGFPVRALTLWRLLPEALRREILTQ